jgi:hypothetical protein
MNHQTIRTYRKAARLLLLLLFFTGSHLMAQEADIIRLVFSERSNFDLTTTFDNDRPATYNLLPATAAWNPYRFHVNEDLSQEGIRKQLERDEHHPYATTYIFRFPLLDTLITNPEKLRLYDLSKTTGQLDITSSKEYRLVKDFRAASRGYLFTVSQPLFTADKQYAFIDLNTYYKTKETKTLEEASFGTTFLVYHFEAGKGWTRVKKIDHVIL